MEPIDFRNRIDEIRQVVKDEGIELKTSFDYKGYTIVPNSDNRIIVYEFHSYSEITGKSYTVTITEKVNDDSYVLNIRFVNKEDQIVKLAVVKRFGLSSGWILDSKDSRVRETGLENAIYLAILGARIAPSDKLFKAYLLGSEFQLTAWKE